jgi:hypothetical protein
MAFLAPRLARFWLPWRVRMLPTHITSTQTEIGHPPTEQILTEVEKRHLRRLTLSKTALTRVDFSRADLRGSKFERVDFSGCDFRNANLVGVWFVQCRLVDVDLTDAYLGLNTFFHSDLAHVRGLSRKQHDYVVACGGAFSTAKTRTPDGKSSKQRGF